MSERFNTRRTPNKLGDCGAIALFSVSRLQLCLCLGAGDDSDSVLQLSLQLMFCLVWWLAWSRASKASIEHGYSISNLAGLVCKPMYEVRVPNIGGDGYLGPFDSRSRMIIRLAVQGHSMSGFVVLHRTSLFYSIEKRR